MAKKKSAKFTWRETQILKLAASDLTNREIGKKIGLTHHAVDFHKRKIYKRARVKGPVGLFKYAVRHGYIRF
jgi:DNA-binding CsgD family transcriptional regulator